MHSDLPAFQNLFFQCVVVLKIIVTLYGCGQICHNCACAFSRSVKNQFFQKGIMYISLDAEFEAD